MLELMAEFNKMELLYQGMTIVLIYLCIYMAAYAIGSGYSEGSGVKEYRKHLQKLADDRMLKK